MKVVLPTNIIEEIKSETKRISGRYEIGGLLLGYRKGSDIQITNITHPHEEDEKSKFYFKRKAKGHQKQTTDLWKFSSNTIDWLGEWHTHPEKVPSPSRIDVRSWRHLVRRHNKPMAFIISGYDEMWVGNVLMSSETQKLTLLEEEIYFRLYGIDE